jgi:hypothetical protein
MQAGRVWVCMAALGGSVTAIGTSPRTAPLSVMIKPS